MNNLLTFRLVTASLILLASGAQAQSLVDGDIDAGKTKSIPCTACHGTEGVSSNPLWPNLAGQSAPYIVAQLQAFKDGKRSDPLMSAQAMALTEDDMQNLAVYYESLPAAVQAVADTASISRAEALYRGGDMGDGIAACIACHGPTGRGNPAARYPALKGQHSTYTAKTLSDYAGGARASDEPTKIMQQIAERLSDEDIQALASYVQGLK